MAQLVKQRRTLRPKVLQALGLITGVNLLIVWLGVDFRLYFSAAVPYYVNFFAHRLILPDWVRLGAGILGLLGCGLYPLCLLLPNGKRLSFDLFLFDSVFLVIFALFFLKNPLCCLPELVAHGAILVLLRP